jgi:hypothetical protein
LERRPIFVIEQAMDILVASYSNSLRLGITPATQNIGNNQSTDGSGAMSEHAMVSTDHAKSIIGDSSSGVSIRSHTTDDEVNPEEVGFYC